MSKLGNFFTQAVALLTQKTKDSLLQLKSNVANLPDDSQLQPQAPVLVPEQTIDSKPQIIETPASIINEKVLEIDVIESGYLIKSEQELPENQLTSRTKKTSQKIPSQASKHARSHSTSRLKQAEQEKRAIIEELKKLDQEIAQIKGETVEDGALKRREKEMENQQAKRQARDLVKQLNVQKRQAEQRKKKEAQKSLSLLKQQEQERKARQAEELQRIKDERRKAIQARMQQEKRKRQERRFIQKQSNRLIQQLKKQEEVLKQREELPQQTGQLEVMTKVHEKKNQVDFREIEQHEKRYIQMKQQSRLVKKQRSESVGRHVPHYQRNVWLQMIQEQDQKKKDDERLKELQRKATLEKRKKYGELVKNIFIPKPKKQVSEDIKEFKEQKPGTPDTNLLPRIAESDKRVTDSKPMKKFMENNRPFATAHPKHPPRPQNKLELKQSVDTEKEKERKLKEAEMRRVTRQRLKKIQGRSLQALPQSKSKPKYQNYLGRIKPKAEQSENWQKIMDNESMSKEEKYKEMMRRAAVMENRAKVKEEVMKEGDEEAVNLYIGSIQAKLAILQKF